MLAACDVVPVSTRLPFSSVSVIRPGDCAISLLPSAARYLRRRLTVANLQLAGKGEYFDAIIRGEKTEEYRLCNDYWNKRIMFREYDRLIITKGYPKRDDSSRRIDVPYDGYEIKTITHPHFGDKPVKVFAIKVNIGNE